MTANFAGGTYNCKVGVRVRGENVFHFRKMHTVFLSELVPLSWKSHKEKLHNRLFVLSLVRNMNLSQESSYNFQNTVYMFICYKGTIVLWVDMFYFYSTVFLSGFSIDCRAWREVLRLWLSPIHGDWNRSSQILSSQHSSSCEWKGRY